jgi:hypothetical protein
MATNLPPAPLVNRDVTVITSAGGSNEAYNDPNSPESIMKKVVKTEAQSITDTRFDVPPDAFTNYIPNSNTSLLLICFSVIGIVVFLLATRRIRGPIRTFFLAAAILLLVLSIALKKKNEC